MRNINPSRSPSAIALDATLSGELTTGIGLYGRMLTRALGHAGVRPIQMGSTYSGDFPRGRMGRTAYVLGRLSSDLLKVRAPVFHALNNYNLPLQRVPGKSFVLTVHDLIPVLFPQTVSRKFRWQFRLWLTRSLQVADQIICVSECTRRDLLNHFPVDGRKLHVVHHGVDHAQLSVEPGLEEQHFLDSLRIQPDFVLYAGSLDVRKNVDLYLEAARRLTFARRFAQVDWVIVGQSGFGAGPVEKKIAQLQARGVRLRVLGYQPESILYRLMRTARTFVFPSRYEGFGLPPLEAMSLGTPTIISKSGALPEICGDAALQVREDDPGALAQAVASLLESDSLRTHWAGLGTRHASRFTWSVAAEKTLQVYRSACHAKIL